MFPSIRIPLLASLLLGAVGTLAAQSAELSPSPTLPSDTLEANYGPRSQAGPTPDRSPTLPSDTLEATQPVDSFPTDPFVDDSVTALPDSRQSFEPDAPVTPADTAALRDIRSWMDRHPGLIVPPPVRAILVRV